MRIEEQVRGALRDPNTSPGKRGLCKIILGEFSRVNDGKTISDEQAIIVIKKMIKSNTEMIGFQSFQNQGMEIVALEYENKLMAELLPKEIIAADMDMLLAIEQNIPDHVSNKIRHMKPVIQYLEDRGFSVDKKRLSELLRGLH